MSNIHRWFEQMWWSPSPPPLWLRCIEPIYSTISQAHLNRRAANIITSPLPMISVGNITAGGSAKTPFVLWLAEQLNAQGYRPVILCRGDGGQNSSAKCISPDDQAACVGDEAKMLADLSSCPVISATDRVAATTLAAEMGDILILDDGFQYRHMERCCDIVLIPVEGIGNRHAIPAGPLREPVTALSRADIIIRTGSASKKHSFDKLGDWHEWQWLTAPLDIIDLMETGISAPTALYAVTAIARPDRFFNDLKNSGHTVTGCRAYPDHHAFSASDVSDILKLGKDIAITAKDAVKLQCLWPKEHPLWLLPQQGHAETGLLPAIQTYLPPK